MGGFTGSRTYAGDVMNTQVQGGGEAQLPPGALAALEQKRRIAAQESQMRLQMQRAQLRAMQQAQRGARGNPEHGGAVNPAMETPWYSQQAVAMTPVTGFNMGGGYTVDPKKLPPGMRPQQAAMGAMGPSGASLAASPPSNQPASGGFTAGQQYAGEGGEGGGPVAVDGGEGERPDWLGTGTTNPRVQQGILIRNAQQRAMRSGPGYAAPPLR